MQEETGGHRQFSELRLKSPPAASARSQAPWSHRFESLHLEVWVCSGSPQEPPLCLAPHPGTRPAPSGPPAPPPAPRAPLGAPPPAPTRPACRGRPPPPHRLPGRAGPRPRSAASASRPPGAAPAPPPRPAAAAPPPGAAPASAAAPGPAPPRSPHEAAPARPPPGPAHSPGAAHGLRPLLLSRQKEKMALDLPQEVTSRLICMPGSRPMGRGLGRGSHWLPRGGGRGLRWAPPPPPTHPPAAHLSPLHLPLLAALARSGAVTSPGGGAWQQGWSWPPWVGAQGAPPWALPRGSAMGSARGV